MWQNSGCLLIYPFVPFAKGFGVENAGSWNCAPKPSILHPILFHSLFCKGTESWRSARSHPRRLTSSMQKAFGKENEGLCPQRLPFSTPKDLQRGRSLRDCPITCPTASVPFAKAFGSEERGKRFLAQRMDPFLVSHYIYISSLKIQNTCLTLSCIMINSSKTWSLFSKVPLTSITWTILSLWIRVNPLNQWYTSKIFCSLIGYWPGNIDEFTTYASNSLAILPSCSYSIEIVFRISVVSFVPTWKRRKE